MKLHSESVDSKDPEQRMDIAAGKRLDVAARESMVSRSRQLLLTTTLDVTARESMVSSK